MKHIKFYLINALSAIMLNNTGLLVQNHNLQHNNQNQLQPNEDFVRKNYADIGEFGPLKSNYKYRDFRLFIYMVPDVYTYFLASIKTNTKQWFINSFLNKGQTPFLHDEWKLTKQKIYGLLGTASRIHQKDSIFFYDQLGAFLNTSFNEFKNIFTYEDDSRNIYFRPYRPWNQEKAEEWSRSNGAILEFDFKPENNSGTIWNINCARISPYVNGVMLLKQYYQNYNNITGQKIPPVAEIKLRQWPTENNPTIRQILPEIQSKLSFLFNIPLQYFKDNRVKFPNTDMNLRVNTSPQTYSLYFYDKYGPPIAYEMMTKIDLYWTKIS